MHAPLTTGAWRVGAAGPKVEAAADLRRTLREQSGIETVADAVIL